MSDGVAKDGREASAEGVDGSSTAPEKQDKPAPLTKTKLFTQGEEGGWTEIGVGSAYVVYACPVAGSQLELTSNDMVPCYAEGSDDANTAAFRLTSLEKLAPVVEATLKCDAAPRLLIEGLDDHGGAAGEARETLLSTPVSADDIYQVQKSTILIWTDPELNRDMAASFHSSSGCKFITEQIEAYRAAFNRAGSGSTRQRSANGAGLQAGNSDTTAYESPWAVTRANLPSLRLAVQNNKQRFALMIRETEDFGDKLTHLFQECRKNADAQGQQLVADIVFSLLNPPFVQDNTILGQLVDELTVETTIDAVQYYIGRRDAASGFISAEERRAQFRNPADLPKDLCQRAHFISAVQRLKDLLPLQLDESDASNFGLLSVYVLRLRFELVQEVVSTDSVMYKQLVLAEDEPLNDSLLNRMAAVVPMLHEITSSVRNSAIPFDPKDSILCQASDNGLFNFISRSFAALLGIDSAPTPPASPTAAPAVATTAAPDSDDAAVAAAAAPATSCRGAFQVPGQAYLRAQRPFAGDPEEGPSEETVQRRVAMSERMIGRLADCLAHLLSFAPKTRRDILVQADDPGKAAPLLYLVFGAISAVEDVVTQQSLYDVVHFVSFKPPITPPELTDRVLDLITLTVDILWTGETVRAQPPPSDQAPAPEGEPLPLVRERLFVAPALTLTHVVSRAAAMAKTAPLPPGLSSQAHYALKAMCFTMQQLNILQENMHSGCHEAVATTLASANFISSVCELAQSSGIPQTLRVSSVQMLNAILTSRNPKFFEVLYQSAADVTAALVNVACAHRHGRHGLLYGSAGSLVRALVVACEDPALGASTGVCRDIAKMALERHGEDLQRGNKNLHEALSVCAVPPPPPTAQSDDGLSSTSMVVGATGRRSQSRPDMGGSSPDSSSTAENPYLSRRMSSTSQHRGHDDHGIPTGTSVDDEFHALMADFDADVPAPSNIVSGSSVAASSEVAGGGEAGGLFDAPGALGFDDLTAASNAITSGTHTPPLSELVPKGRSSVSPTPADSNPPELKRTRSERQVE